MCFGSLVYFSDGYRPSDKGEPGHPDPEIRGAQSRKNVLGPFWPQSGLKVRGALGPTTVLGSFVSVQVA